MSTPPILFIDDQGKAVREPQASFDARIASETRPVTRRARVTDLLTRRRSELRALPAPPDRTPAQRRTAQDLRDWIALAALLLETADGQDTDETDQ